MITRVVCYLGLLQGVSNVAEAVCGWMFLVGVCVCVCVYIYIYTHTHNCMFRRVFEICKVCIYIYIYISKPEASSG